MPVNVSRPLDAAVSVNPNVCDDVHAAAPRVALVDASTLAAELGISRDYVYEHSEELGALRLGNGPKARLRFDPVAVRAAMACCASKQSQAPDLALADGSRHVDGHSKRRSGRSSATGRPQAGSILPVRPRRRAAA
jgi:hypothetical protein